MNKKLLTFVILSLLLLLSSCAEAGGRDTQAPTTPSDSTSESTNVGGNEGGEETPVYEIKDGIAYKHPDYVLTTAAPSTEIEGKKVLPTLASALEKLDGDSKLALSMAASNQAKLTEEIVADIEILGIKAERYLTGSTCYYLFPTEEQFKKLPKEQFEGIIFDIISEGDYLKGKNGHTQLKGRGVGSIGVEGAPSGAPAFTLAVVGNGGVISSKETDSFGYPNTTTVSYNGLTVGEEVKEVLSSSVDSSCKMMLTVRNKDGSLLSDADAVIDEIIEKNNVLFTMGALNGDLYIKLTKNQLLTLKLDNKENYLFNLACAYRLNKQMYCKEVDGILYAPQFGRGWIQGGDCQEHKHNGCDIACNLVHFMEQDTLLKASDVMAIDVSSEGKSMGEGDKAKFTALGFEAKLDDGRLLIFSTKTELDKINEQNAQGYAFSLAAYK